MDGAAMTSLGPIRTGLSASGRGSPAATGHTPTDFSHETLTGCDPRARPRRQPSVAVFQTPQPRAEAAAPVAPPLPRAHRMSR